MLLWNSFNERLVIEKLHFAESSTPRSGGLKFNDRIQAEMLEDKAAKATAKATFARAYYENEKNLIEKRQAAHRQRKSVC